MRNMSFSLTTEQVRKGEKTVTRRFGWWFLQPGDVLMAVEKAMGLKKGEKVVEIRPILIVSTRREPLGAITKEECIKEGFPHLTPAEFCQMLVGKTGKTDGVVNRVEFEYVNVTTGTRKVRRVGRVDAVKLEQMRLF